MSSNLILLIVVGIVVLLLVLWLFAASRKTSVAIDSGQGDEPVRRNQALIDAAPVIPDMPIAMPVAMPPAPEEIGDFAPATVVEAHTPAGEDLTRIKGLGPKLAEQLQALGVSRLDQIAAWTDADVDRIDGQLGRFQGRIRRDDWVNQARMLADGDTAGYEAKFGRL